MRDDTKTALLIWAAIAGACAVPVGLLLIDSVREWLTPNGMVYTAGNGPSGKAYEKDHERRPK